MDKSRGFTLFLVNVQQPWVNSLLEVMARYIQNYQPLIIKVKSMK